MTFFQTDLNRQLKQKEREIREMETGERSVSPTQSLPLSALFHAVQRV